MQGVLRVHQRPAKIKVRVTNRGTAGADVSVTDMMLQPGGAVSGWLPHVTELPWSAGIQPPEGSENVDARLIELQNRLDDQQIYIDKIASPALAWRLVSGDQSVIQTKWDPDYGWVSWLDVGRLAGSGEVALFFPAPSTLSTTARPFAWSMDVFTQGLAGVTGLSPRVQYMNGSTVSGQNDEVSLQAWPDWSYRVEHDFILPASRTARPAFLLLSKTSTASGLIGLSRPRLGAKSERSQ